MPAIPALELETGVSRGSLANPMALSPNSVSPHGKILVSERHCLKKNQGGQFLRKTSIHAHTYACAPTHTHAHAHLIYNVATY